MQTGLYKIKPEYTAENILSRDFSATKPNEKWLCDVTEYKIQGQKQKLYLCAIFDLFDNSIVSYKTSIRNDNQLVFSTFDQAKMNNPTASHMVHSDRGYQFTSICFKKILKDNNCIQSMSRVGRCIDIGPIEGFWGIIKSEMYYLNRFENIDKFRKYIDDYIMFYNNIRLQSKLKCLSSIEYRKQALIC